MAHAALLSAAVSSAWLVSTSAGNQLSQSVTPVEKVITLLEDLATQIEGEGAAEATTYDTFACFCKTKTTDRSTAVTTSQDTIDDLAAAIEQNSASKADKEADLLERTKKQEDLKRELEAEQARCAAEMAEFAATVADYENALTRIEKAIEAMEASKPASLVEIRKIARESLELATSLNLVTAPRKKTVQAFLQESLDPNDPDYKFQSQGIIETLTDLQNTFTKAKNEEQTEWDKARDACTETENVLSGQITDNQNAMDILEQDIDGLKTTIATDRESLVEEEATLKDDKQYLMDLTERCEARAKDWDQRTTARAGELEALRAALKILTGGGEGIGVQGLDESVNKRALLQANASAPAAGRAPARHLIEDTAVGRQLLRDIMAPRPVLVSKHSGHKKAVRSHHPAAAQASSRERDRVVALLKTQGSRIQSSMLFALAEKLAKDPFSKVKDLIQKLIERLVHEATQEATKKGFCDTELGKAEKTQGYRFEEVQKLLAELGTLEAKKVSLEESIVDLEAKVADLRDGLNTTTHLREEEKEENLESIKTAKEGHAAVLEALQILKSFYKQAAKASLVQASPVDEDTEGAGFEGSYKGNQDSAKGIIGILEVVASDFDRTVRKTEEAEKEAMAAFVEFHRTAVTDIAAKERQLEIDQEELMTTKEKIDSKMDDLSAAQGLLDGAFKTIEDLKPMCMDTGMSYEDRVRKREEEIAALNTALTILAPP